jgi:hypothetical protein
MEKALSSVRDCGVCVCARMCKTVRLSFERKFTMDVRLVDGVEDLTCQIDLAAGV